GGNLGVLEPGDVGVAEEIVAGRHRGVHRRSIDVVRTRRARQRGCWRLGRRAGVRATRAKAEDREEQKETSHGTMVACSPGPTHTLNILTVTSRRSTLSSCE